MAKITKIRLRANGDVPNNPKWPALIYRALIKRNTRNKSDIFEAYFRQNGWRGVWRDTIYKFCHFHTNAHEALGIGRGSVTVELGGEGGKTVTLRSGDMLVMPAGTGHKRIMATKNLVVIGAYPKGQEKYNMCKDMKDCRNVLRKIAAVKAPQTDPFYGVNGPITKIWK